MGVNFKCSIRTFVLGANHGQLLQAVGLKHAIEKHFRIKVMHDLHHNHFFAELKFIVRSLSFIKFLTLLSNWLFYIRFSRSSSPRDITVFGADTIWMFNHPVAKIDDFYFGNDLDDSYRIAYSPSNAGNCYRKNSILISNLSMFYFAGVRDSSTQTFIKDYINKDTSITCDPAFFLCDKFDIKKSALNYNCISVYATSIRTLHPLLKCSSVLKVINIRKFQYFGYFPNFWTHFLNQCLGIKGVLNGIRNSNFLITDTYHGLIMGLITQVPFVLIDSDIVRRRIEGSIIDLFDNSRIIHKEMLESSITNKKLHVTDDIDYNKLNIYIKNSEEKLVKEINDLLR